jgi:hypothetical protein
MIAGMLRGRSAPGPAHFVERPAKRFDFLLVGGLLTFGNFEQFQDFVHFLECVAQGFDDLVYLLDGAFDGFGRGAAPGRGRKLFARRRVAIAVTRARTFPALFTRRRRFGFIRVIAGILWLVFFGAFGERFVFGIPDAVAILFGFGRLDAGVTRFFVIIRARAGRFFFLPGWCGAWRTGRTPASASATSPSGAPAAAGRRALKRAAGS